MDGTFKGIERMKNIFVFITLLLTSACSDDLEIQQPSNTNSKKIILIGDSIAEGHPHLHSHLHKGSVNEPGQISYELGNLLGENIENAGIGGNTSTDLRKRWSRDIENKKPTHIFIHVGINDVFKIDTKETIENFDFFIHYAETNNIKLYFSNIGPHLDHTPETIKNATFLNNSLLDYEKIYSHVIIIDYLSWATDGTNNFKHLKDGMFADYTHPNKNGYKSYSEFIYKSIKAL